MLTIQDRLQVATRYLLDTLTPTQRGNMIAWVLEGRPMTMLKLIQEDGSRCLLGTAEPDDARLRSLGENAIGGHLFTIGLEAVGERNPIYTTTAWDTAAGDLGIEAARAIVAAEIRAWMREPCRVLVSCPDPQPVHA